MNQFVDDKSYVNRKDDHSVYEVRMYDGANEKLDTRLVAGNCYADWTCGTYYSKLGKDIKNVFNYGVYGGAGCKSCGE